ncbi:MAG: hypothetical protein K1Y01_07750 [Vicinamibacteria bacterium]|nr:hypothetical protein [Vicinamibacteria bacterium]
MGKASSPAFTTASAARLLRMAGRTFARLVEAGVFVPSIRGRGRAPAQFDGAAIVAAYIAHREQRRGTLDLAQERAALARAQREKLEREARLRAGELLEADAVEEAWAAIVDVHREALLGLAGDLVSSGAITPEQERAVDDVCRTRLQVLADRGSDAQ